MDVKLGICNFCVPGTGIFAPKFVAEAGLDGMSIDYGLWNKGFPLSSRRLQDAYIEARTEHGIEYPNVGMSTFDFMPLQAAPGSEDDQMARGAIRGAIDAAAYLGIPLVFIPTFVKSAIEDDEDFRATVDVFRYACELAADKGISIASENELSAKRQIELVDRVDMPNFGIMYDSDNLFQKKGYDQVEMLESLYMYLSPQLHVKDGKTGILAGSLLGEGDANFAGVMEVLRRRNYSGWIIIENLYEEMPLRARNADVFETFHRDVQILKQAVA